MSISVPLVARLAIRGRLQYRRADGTVIEEVEIVDGSLPIVGGALAAAVSAAPEPSHDHDHQ